MSYRLCVAPMMERTDRHFRYLARLLSPNVRLYTEMITAKALLRGDAQRLLEFHPAEHPVALQLGGSDPDELAAAARIGEARGYDEINLNVGCPSDRVQAGCFGVALMREPDRVACCVAAMRAAVSVPVTVKTRLGVDELDSYDYLHAFVGRLAAEGCPTVVVHARKAWLHGLSPKENREIPPLDYARVYRLKADFPSLTVVINGGLTDVATSLAQLAHVDGLMIGRAAYHDPWLIAELDRRLFGSAGGVTRAAAAAAFVSYAATELERGTRLRAVTRHLSGLYARQSGGRNWRRRLTELPDDARGVAALESLVASYDHAPRPLASVELALAAAT